MLIKCVGQDCEIGDNYDKRLEICLPNKHSEGGVFFFLAFVVAGRNRSKSFSSLVFKGEHITRGLQRD